MIKTIFKILIVLSLLLVVPTYAATTRKCTISFSAKGGTGTMEKMEATKGSTIKINPCTYTKDGYYFKGWEDDMGHTYDDQGYIVVDTDKHLYALWSKLGDSSDPQIVKINNDDKILKEISEYQTLRGLDPTIKTNTWYNVGGNLWYLIGNDGLPIRGWYEEKTILNRGSGIIIPTPSEAPVIATDDKKNYIINEPKIAPEVSPSKKISTNVKANAEEPLIKRDESRWYYLDPDTCLMSIGWKVIDREYYYFAEKVVEAEMVFDKVAGQFVSNGNEKEIGQMYSNEYTPDGRFVNSKGCMVNQYR